MDIFRDLYNLYEGTEAFIVFMLKPFHQFSHQAGNPWNGVQWLHKGFQLNMYIYSLYLSTHLPTYLPTYLSIYLSIAVTLGAETWCSSLSS